MSLLPYRFLKVAAAYISKASVSRAGKHADCYEISTCSSLSQAERAEKKHAGSCHSAECVGIMTNARLLG